MITDVGWFLLVVWLVFAVPIMLGKTAWFVPSPESWLWKLGENDPVRLCFYNSDGKLRRFVPAALLIWVTLWVLVAAIFAQVFL